MGALLEEAPELKVLLWSQLEVPEKRLFEPKG
jgi:hypothetical protein